MIHWAQGLFGFVARLDPLLSCLAPYGSNFVVSRSSTPPHAPPAFDGDLSISGLQRSYREGLSPVTVVEIVFGKIEEYAKVDPAVWIYRAPKASVIDQVRQLQAKWPKIHCLPTLFGVPFSVKDSIDIAGIPTTTACPTLAHVPSVNAPSYNLLISQGAIFVGGSFLTRVPFLVAATMLQNDSILSKSDSADRNHFIGKTNLDQLATGLTGCRSPYGITRSVFNHEYISGGSSSGSCVSVGAGLVSFSLATDTAGSGRVPSGFNGVVGYKPTRGLISAQGVTPACLSLDCIAIIAGNVNDARTVWDLSVGFDEGDRYAKACMPIPRHVNSIGPQAGAFKFGIPPPEALAVCSAVYRRLFNAAVQTLQQLGGRLVGAYPPHSRFLLG